MEPELLAIGDLARLVSEEPALTIYEHYFDDLLRSRAHIRSGEVEELLAQGDDGSVTFHEATPFSADDVLRLERTLPRRVLRLFQRRGLLTEDTVEDMLTWQASGGFSLDASVRIHGSDSAGRERLLRPGTRRRRVARGRPSRWSACVSSATAKRAEQRTTAAPHGDSGVHRVIYLPYPPATAAPSSPSRPSSFSPH